MGRRKNPFMGRKENPFMHRRQKSAFAVHRQQQVSHPMKLGWQ